MKSALITGASRGLGESLVVSFLRRGYRVFGLVRSSQAATRMQESAAGAIPIVGDVTDPEIGTALDAALRQYSEELNVLINNAGRGASICSLRQGVEEEVAEHISVHCIGALRISRAAVPYLRRSGTGLIVNVSSRFGSISNAAAGLLSGRSISYAYPIAKAAQNMLTLRMAEELGTTCIRVCAVHPGRMQTASGSPDAIDTAAEAAERLVEWIGSPPGCLHGNFFELDTGKHGW